MSKSISSGPIYLFRPPAGIEKAGIFLSSQEKAKGFSAPAEDAEHHEATELHGYFK
jgi:hypothetical protein